MVSESHDQSYYEIALTNRQVMSIFVVLLVCVLAAFLGGVWLGRGALPDAGAVQTASAQEIVAGVGAGENQLGELDFFDRRDQSAGQVAPESDSRAAARAEGTDGNSDDSPGQRPVLIEDSKPADTSDGSSGRAAPAAPEAAPSRGATSNRSNQRDASPQSEAAVPDFVVIQVFSSTDEAQARRIVDRLRVGGYPAILSPVEVDEKTLYRVRIGPYTDPDEAEVIAARVRSAFELDTWITH